MAGVFPTINKAQQMKLSNDIIPHSTTFFYMKTDLIFLGK